MRSEKNKGKTECLPRARKTFNREDTSPHKSDKYTRRATPTKLDGPLSGLKVGYSYCRETRCPRPLWPVLGVALCCLLRNGDTEGPATAEAVEKHTEQQTHPTGLTILQRVIEKQRRDETFTPKRRAAHVANRPYHYSWRGGAGGVRAYTSYFHWCCCCSAKKASHAPEGGINNGSKRHQLGLSTATLRHLDTYIESSLIVRDILSGGMGCY